MSNLKKYSQVWLLRKTQRLLPQRVRQHDLYCGLENLTKGNNATVITTFCGRDVCRLIGLFFHSLNIRKISYSLFWRTFGLLVQEILADLRAGDYNKK